MKIQIDKHESIGTMLWHPVQVIIDEKPYYATVCEMNDAVSGTSSFEVTWVDDTPDNRKEIEEQIIDELNQ